MGGLDLRTILSKNIKLYRNRHSWSQADLAEKADISINFLSNIERGTKWPYPETLNKLALALGIEVFELFKPEKTLADDSSILMERLVQDISISVNASIESTYRQYRREG
jgi:transcriptional regulator with XRE-family HTH domain